jgi:hypothetical protein
MCDSAESRRTKLRTKGASDRRRSRFREEVSSSGSDEIRTTADEIVSGALRRNSSGETCNPATTPFSPCNSKRLKQDSSRIAASIYEIDFANKETTMRKLFFSIGAIAAAATAVFVWSHTMLTPTQASYVSSINPTELLASYTGPLPTENWDAF